MNELVEVRGAPRTKTNHPKGRKSTALSHARVEICISTRLALQRMESSLSQRRRCKPIAQNTVAAYVFDRIGDGRRSSAWDKHTYAAKQCRHAADSRCDAGQPDSHCFKECGWSALVVRR